MKPDKGFEPYEPDSSRKSGADRRRGERYDTSLAVSIRFLPDGTPLQGFAVEMSPNGMRLMTPMPLIEASYIHISFESASNNTHCEGRVVWTQPSKEPGRFESGIDVQRWGGGTPGHDPINEMPQSRPKTDRRKGTR
jgi:hypothetical protein